VRGRAGWRWGGDAQAEEEEVREHPPPRARHHARPRTYCPRRTRGQYV